MKYPPTKDRLLSRIQEVNGCWIYTGCKGSAGYGKLAHNGKAMDAHRVSWLVHYGDIAPGLCVCRKCDIKACVNPSHLFLGTYADNIHDMHKKRREARGKPLSDAIKLGWTAEKRLMRAKQMRDRHAKNRTQRKIEAGVSPDWKFCAKSQHWLPLVSFGKNAARHDGVNVYCKACTKAS